MSTDLIAVILGAMFANVMAVIAERLLPVRIYLLVVTLALVSLLVSLWVLLS